MYAMFQVSGFQFKAEEGTTIRIPRQKAEVGDKLTLEQVMLVRPKAKKCVSTNTSGAPNTVAARVTDRTTPTSK